MSRLRGSGTTSVKPECGKAWFVEPTIYGEVRNSMRVAQEEFFGEAVLSILRFKDEAVAIMR
jgi:aldehyde dehydrogenase (NAD+)